MEGMRVGDLVITLPEVEKINSLTMSLVRGTIGIIVEHTAKLGHVVVYKVSIDDKLYYLFEDEIKKLEEKC